MVIITFIIAIIALIISLLAYRRAGGTRELKKTVDSLTSTVESVTGRAGVGLKEQVEHLTSVTESLREKTADIIDRVEKAVRKEEPKKLHEEEPSRGKPPRQRRPRQRKG